jgi:hypothetical protein
LIDPHHIEYTLLSVQFRFCNAAAFSSVGNTEFKQRKLVVNRPIKRSRRCKGDNNFFSKRIIYLLSQQASPIYASPPLSPSLLLNFPLSCLLLHGIRDFFPKPTRPGKQSRYCLSNPNFSFYHMSVWQNFLILLLGWFGRLCRLEWLRMPQSEWRPLDRQRIETGIAR